MEQNKMSSFRWTVCTLIFFATTINYLDRAVISLLKSNLEIEFHWTETDYSNIVVAFQITYAAGLLFMGKVIDYLGSKIGYGITIFMWSLAAVGHALVKTNVGFIIARSALGITEAGNFPAAIKTVAEWFPKKERALCTGIFNSGANIGAILAPLTVPFILLHFGWRWAFIITGSIGFIWLILWLAVYEIPSRKAKLSSAEFDYIHSDTESSDLTHSIQRRSNSAGFTKEKADIKKHDEKVYDKAGGSVSWIKLLEYRQTWAFAIGKFLTDPAWWFYLFWLPAFLKAQYKLDGTQIVLPIASVYTLSSIGSVLGGYLPLRLIKQGMTVLKARKLSMLIYACCAAPVLLAQYAGSFNMWFAILIIGFAAAAHQAWSANIYTTVSDFFPNSAVGSVIGIGGMAGAVGGIAIAKLAGSIFDHYKALGHIQTGYYIMFFICGLTYILAWLLMQVLIADKSQKIPLNIN